MKTLTICQPFASLIVTPQTLLPPGEVPKRIENRSWITSYRGPLLIHAGLSKRWLGEDAVTAQAVEEHWRASRQPLVFGAIIGVAWVIDVVSIEAARQPGCRHKWIKKHAHASGEQCWVLDACRPLVTPLFCSGAQGLWNAPGEHVLAARVCRLTSSGALDPRHFPGTLEEYRKWGLTERMPLRDLPAGDRS